MAGITSDIPVYDIFHPTPVPLKELSAIVVSLEVWRFKLNEYRNHRKLKEFCPSSEHIPLKTLLPDLPSMIYAAIDKYVGKFGHSLENWMNQHHLRIFYFHYDHQSSAVLKYFQDFVCDYNGVIDYERTAERMMHCERFDSYQKFMIACTYFFEDDIRRIWPLVSGNVDLNNIIMFYKSPQLYYWICCLTNKLDKIPIFSINISIEEVMFNAYMPLNRPSIEYFWNRLPAEKRMRKAVDIFECDVVSFVRFILPKFDDQELNEFVNRRCYRLIRSLSEKAPNDEELILSTWVYVKNAINVDAFANLVRRMLLKEIKGLNPQNWSQLCCEIWNDAAEELKHAAVTVITSNHSRFSEDLKGLTKSGTGMSANSQEFKFLLSFLSFANYKERRRFWFNCWNNLFKRVGLRCKDLQKIMNVCFEYKDEMIQFKENAMVNNASVRKFCRLSLSTSRFDELNNFASFLFSEVQEARYFKQQLLQRNLLRDDCLFRLIRHGVKKFNQFVDDAYTDAEHSANFKNLLMSLPKTQECLSRNALKVPLKYLLEFIDTFVSAEDILLQIKELMIGVLKEKVAVDESVLHEFSFTSFLSWCLGSTEEVENFYRNYLDMNCD